VSETEPVTGKQKAYVLVRVKPGKELDLYDELKQIRKVEIDFVRGQFDFVVVVKGTPSDVERVILKIRATPFVLSTETLTAFEFLPWEEVTGQLDYGHI